MRRIYQYFGFDFGDEAESRMRTWALANPQGVHGGHHYSARDFGLSEGAMAELFSDYVEHFQVAREKLG